MDIKLTTAAAFEHRLAELAWENADELTKRTVSGALVSQLLATPKAFDEIITKVTASLMGTVIDTLKKTSDFKELPARLSEICKSRMESDAFKQSIAEAINKAVETHAREMVSVGTVADETRHINIQVAVQNAICDWSKNQMMKYLDSIETSLTINSKTVLINLLEATLVEVRAMQPPKRKLKR